MDLYADLTEGDRVKIFPNESFGFQRITVERPPRLRREVTDETIAAVEASKAFAKLPEDAAAVLVALTEGRRPRLGDLICSRNA